MKVIGIICEYNPFHLGHAKQITRLKTEFSDDCAVVCLMSGNFVQRGAPAIFDKSLRAQAAIHCGADLVLELPVQYALSSAEGFAAGGVRILSGFCDYLSFGCESGNPEGLMAAATALLSPEFPGKLRVYLEQGLSFPAARQKALGDLGSMLQKPNDILAVEYCKAMLAQKSAMRPLPMHRPGDYHSLHTDPENPSATALRELIMQGRDWSPFVPEAAMTVFKAAPVYSLASGERAILARLRSMTEGEFEALPYGSEGLWRKLMHNVHSCGTLEEILTATKSKRYTRTRLDRMVMCAYLGLSAQQMQAPPAHVQVLALNDTGKKVLKIARTTGCFPHVGEEPTDLERRIDDLYGLFALDAPRQAGGEAKRRVFIL